MRPAVNGGAPTVPQLLTARSEHFLWAAKLMGEMGYTQVDLNLGCPSGTVVSKHKGAGMLADPAVLEDARAYGFNMLSFANNHAMDFGINGLVDTKKAVDAAGFVNAGVGANLDEAALLEALDSGKVRAAGLDVWATEPSANAALYGHPHVSCTPHIGAATVEAQARIGQEIVEIIKDFTK